jgi:hypothetical protein
MHPYSTDVNRLRLVLLVLAVGAILLAWGLGHTLSALQLTAPWWLDTPAVLGFYGGLWQLYDRVLWQLGPVDRTLSGVPNLRGTWRGTLTSSFDEQTYDATLVVRQTSSRILIELRTGASRSHSYLAGVSAAPGPDEGLRYLYRNVPDEGATHTMNAHGGSARLQFSDGVDTLSGGYQSDRFRGTHGTLRFTRNERRSTEAVA